MVQYNKVNLHLTSLQLKKISDTVKNILTPLGLSAVMPATDVAI